MLITTPGSYLSQFLMIKRNYSTKFTFLRDYSLKKYSIRASSEPIASNRVAAKSRVFFISSYSMYLPVASKSKSISISFL